MSSYDVKYPKEFFRDAVVLDRDKCRCQLLELLELRMIQLMEECDKKRDLLAKVDEDMAMLVPDPQYTKAMINYYEAMVERAERRLKLQDAFDAYRASMQAWEAASEALNA
jgi:hypothetical protein